MTLQPLELLRVLREHEVDFVVIGAFAVAAHGYVRATKDVDVIPRPDCENLEPLAAALERLEARHELGDLRAEEMPLELDVDSLEQRGNWFLETRSADSTSCRPSKAHDRMGSSARLRW